jgi:hypothetical protein
MYHGSGSTKIKWLLCGSGSPATLEQSLWPNSDWPETSPPLFCGIRIIFMQLRLRLLYPTKPYSIRQFFSSYMILCDIIGYLCEGDNFFHFFVICFKISNHVRLAAPVPTIDKNDAALAPHLCMNVIHSRFEDIESPKSLQVLYCRAFITVQHFYGSLSNLCTVIGI